VIGNQVLAIQQRIFLRAADDHFDDHMSDYALARKNGERVEAEEFLLTPAYSFSRGFG